MNQEAKIYLDEFAKNASEDAVNQIESELNKYINAINVFNKRQKHIVKLTIISVLTTQVIEKMAKEGILINIDDYLDKLKQIIKEGLEKNKGQQENAMES